MIRALFRSLKDPRHIQPWRNISHLSQLSKKRPPICPNWLSVEFQNNPLLGLEIGVHLRGKKLPSACSLLAIRVPNSGLFPMFLNSSGVGGLSIGRPFYIESEY